MVKQQAVQLTPADVLHEPVALEFLGLESKEKWTENDLEEAIISHLKDFLLEMGNESLSRMDIACYSNLKTSRSDLGFDRFCPTIPLGFIKNTRIIPLGFVKKCYICPSE